MPGTTVRSKLRLAKSTVSATTPVVSEEIVADDGFTPQVTVTNTRHNPLADFIDDDTFSELQGYRLIDRKSLRDYQIRKFYRQMREQMPARQALETLHGMHPYLEFDTIRKIVYQITPKVS